MENLKFTKNHEWVRVEGDKAVIGISDYAQHAMGDVVFVELPEVDASFKQDEGIATIESVKAVSDVYAPISGKVIEVNEKLEDEPALINEDAYGEGWVYAVEIENVSELDNLMSNSEYEEFIKK
ncbi:glycine cleavage system protein H [endosymbiont 'TC1' of Trimyema compressum]|uniref:glycine cleavage system protein GcvH n=1 Tax=endosymbiont 'TC1' of Trimyema compressum TaxID=243899 RepID=UPI0007F127E5|nr:glycine cleavage system protein GcvH [endosymbiont 'TC1' of Trimyema compressum]AMP21382.1 glycine cleavage system protein H [endosymbiont 'TC1' of Trimyema compressum]